jgi:EmrB/QacA subfamily drug resistance transporter
MNAPLPSSPPSVPPVDDGELPRGVVIATMAGVIAAMLMGALDGTIVGTAMPRVIADLHGFEHYAAVTTVYMLTSTLVVPIVGKLSDIYGRKTFLLLGVAIFVAGSVLCGAASSMMQLVLFRGLQGIGGGMAQGMAFTTVADLFPPAKRGRIGGLMGSVFGLASIIGPAVGGFLTDGPGWRWCFWVNIPIGIAAFVVLLFAFPSKKPSGAKPAIDYLGALTLVCAATPLLLALSWGGRDYAWSSPLIVAMLAGGSALAILFFFVERKAPGAIIPPQLFKNRIIAASAAGAMLIGVGMFGALIFIPLFMQGVVGTSATKSGTVMTPMMFAMIASSIIAGQIMTRVGRYKVVAVVGAIVVTTGLALLATMSIDTTYTGVLVRMIVMGIGLGITMPVFNLAAQNAVDPREVGVATSSLQFLRQMGGSVGAAIFGAIMTNRFVAAFHEALPADVAARVPAGALAQFENPQMLMNPEAQSALQSGALAPVLAPLLQAVKVALSSSLTTVFVACTVVTSLAIVATVLLKDVPLRKTNRMTAAAPTE